LSAGADAGASPSIACRSRRARDTGFDRADGAAADGGRLFIFEAVRAEQALGLALLRRQLLECTTEIVELDPACWAGEVACISISAASSGREQRRIARNSLK